MQFAEFDIVRCRASLDDPSMQEFVDNFDRIFSLAESCPGFVWRLNEGDNDASSYLLYEDPKIMVNMSVWQTAEDLRHFMFGTDHELIMPRGKDWFVAMEQPKVACWWIEEGSIPTLEEGRDRLEFLQGNGESEYAFGYRNLKYCKSR
jgi:hypothetical protein